MLWILDTVSIRHLLTYFRTFVVCAKYDEYATVQLLTSSRDSLLFGLVFHATEDIWLSWHSQWGICTCCRVPLPPATVQSSEMTYIVSGGALNSTHSAGATLCACNTVRCWCCVRMQMVTSWKNVEIGFCLLNSSTSPVVQTGLFTQGNFLFSTASILFLA